MICLLLMRIISKIKSEVILRVLNTERTAKDRDVVTTNSLANTTLGQSERAYYLSKLG